MKQVLVATRNPGKQAEIIALFSGSPITLLFPKSIPALRNLEIAETGETLEENATLKASKSGIISQTLCLADDSGLFISAFHGFPGVMSDRWHPGTATEKNQALLQRMQHLTNRSAQFVTVVALYNPFTQTTWLEKGIIKGTISKTLSGADGFGYDAVFIPQGYTQTLAQLGTDIKNKISARSLAFSKARKYLEDTIC